MPPIFYGRKESKWFILILKKDWDGWLRRLDRIFSKREFSFSERVSIHDLNTHPLTKAYSDLNTHPLTLTPVYCSLLVIAGAGWGTGAGTAPSLSRKRL